MQRLKQHNEGAVLPFDTIERLSGRAQQSFSSGGWCTVRMRVETSGEAERSVHWHRDAHHSAFLHEMVMLAPNVADALVAAAQRAFSEREALPPPEQDPQGVYRRLTFRDSEGRSRIVLVEYRSDRSVGPAGAFEAAWKLAAASFPLTGTIGGQLSELRW